MEFTNKRNFPRGIKNFLEYNDYTAGARTDISVTKLIGSPLVAALWREYGREVIEDNADRTWSQVGSGIHSRFEAANATDSHMLMEKRFFASIDVPFQEKPITLSGQIDAFDMTSLTLADVKTSGVYKVLLGDTEDWENQLNVNRYLMHMNGFDVSNLEIWSLAKDWSKARAKEDDYPDHPISVIPIHMWELEQTREYIFERLELHFGDTDPQCTDKDRWARPAKFAVMKTGRKSALRLLDSKEAAESWVKSQAANQKGISIVERPAQYVRCDGYCPFKSMGVCPNYS